MADNDIEIEDGMATFHLNMVGKPSNQTYLGTFKVHCILNPIDFIKADRAYRDLIGPNNPHLAHEHAQTTSFALSQLKYRMVEPYPPFWQNAEDPKWPGGHLKDDNIIITVLNKAMDAEQQYRTEMLLEQENIQKSLAKGIEKGDIEKEPDVEEAIERQKKKSEEEIDLD